MNYTVGFLDVSMKVKDHKCQISFGIIFEILKQFKKVRMTLKWFICLSLTEMKISLSIICYLLPQKMNWIGFFPHEQF